MHFCLCVLRQMVSESFKLNCESNEVFDLSQITKLLLWVLRWFEGFSIFLKFEADILFLVKTLFTICNGSEVVYRFDTHYKFNCFNFCHITHKFCISYSVLFSIWFKCVASISLATANTEKNWIFLLAYFHDSFAKKLRVIKNSYDISANFTQF